MVAITVPAGSPVPAPPAGTVWRFSSHNTRTGDVELISIPDEQPEPTPPIGSSWRLIQVDGQRIYIAIPHPFMRGIDTT